MKARVKAIGEIVDVLPYAEKDGTVRFYANMENKWYEAYEIDIVSEVPPPDYWEKLKHQYAGMAMQGILSCDDIKLDFTEHTDELFDAISITSVKISTALVNKLKEESQCEK